MANLLTRGAQMGISCGPTASIAELDGTKELGLGWVRVSHEAGWPGTTISLGTTVKEAHARGLKVLQCIQLAGHKYAATDLPVLSIFAINCVDTGVDAIEIGNEFNNAAFFQPHVLPPTLAASLTAGIAKAIRAQNPTIPIITNGLSPAPLPYSAHVYWPTFWDSRADEHKAAGYTVAAALHPFVYPEDPCTMMSHPEWNPWAAVPIIRRAMVTRGIKSPIWFTEIGCPGTNQNVSYIRGIGLTELRQEFVTKQYLKQYKTLGLPNEPLFIATLFDGQSVSVPGPEEYLGLIRRDGTKKLAWYAVRKFASELLP
jgi:hypothetical protein